jgi:ATP phosphoribosyltransferase regulatory subunit
MTLEVAPATAGEALYQAQFQGLQFLRQRGFTPVVLPLVYPAAGESPGGFRFLDGEGQVWAVRADFTPLVAKAFARTLLGQKDPLRLCYAGEVARKIPAGLRGVAEFFQLGFESFAVQDEAEKTMDLALSLAAQLGVPGTSLVLTLSQVGVAESMLRQLLEDEPDGELLQLMVAKDLAALAERLGLSPRAQDMLRQALWAEGQEWVGFFGLQSLWERFGQVRQQAQALGVVARLEVAPRVEASYYRGLVFSLWGKRNKLAVASGGEYWVETPKGPVPAVGCTLSLNRLLEERPC